jgi:hypothetical protein
MLTTAFPFSEQTTGLADGYPARDPARDREALRSFALFLDVRHFDLACTSARPFLTSCPETLDIYNNQTSDIRH